MSLSSVKSETALHSQTLVSLTLAHSELLVMVALRLFTFEDLRRFQLHVVASVVSTAAINWHVSALRFFFRVTLKRYAIVEHTRFIREPRKLSVVLSPQEVAWLLDAAPVLKYKAALSVAYGAGVGLRAAKVVSLKVSRASSGRSPRGTFYFSACVTASLTISMARYGADYEIAPDQIAIYSSKVISAA